MPTGSNAVFQFLSESTNVAQSSKGRTNSTSIRQDQTREAADRKAFNQYIQQLEEQFKVGSQQGRRNLNLLTGSIERHQLLNLEDNDVANFTLDSGKLFPVVTLSGQIDEIKLPDENALNQLNDWLVMTGSTRDIISDQSLQLPIEVKIQQLNDKHILASDIAFNGKLGVLQKNLTKTGGTALESVTLNNPELEKPVVDEKLPLQGKNALFDDFDKSVFKDDKAKSKTGIAGILVGEKDQAGKAVLAFKSNNETLQTQIYSQLVTEQVKNSLSVEQNVGSEFLSVTNQISSSEKSDFIRLPVSVDLNQQFVNRGQMLSSLSAKIHWMLQQGIGTAEIMLDPPELGPLNVKISQYNGETNVQFQVANSTTKEIVDANLARLREMLLEQGLTLGDTLVQQENRQAKSSEKIQSANQDNLEETDVTEDVVTTQASVQLISQGMVDIYT